MDQARVAIRAHFIYRAVENGWTVRKQGANKFEFTVGGTGTKNETERTRRRCISAPNVTYY